MNKPLKRTLSIILSTLIMLSVFAVLPTTASAAETSTTSTVYFDNSVTNWSTVYCYAWGDTGNNKLWPGEAMTNVDGDIWGYTLKGNYSGIVFSIGSSQSQSDDLEYQGTGMLATPTSSDYKFSVTWTEYTGTATVPTSSIDSSDGSLTYNGHTYRIYNGVCDTWEEAKEYCESLGGYLAVINDENENQVLFDYMINQGYESAYFGFSNAEDESTWKWVSNDDSSYTNWADGEPNDATGSERYAMFYYKYEDGTWNDGDFNGDTDNDVTTFICEWDSTSSSDTDDEYFALYEDSNSFKHVNATYTFGDNTYLLKLMSSNYIMADIYNTYKYLGSSSGVCHGIALSMCYANQGYVDFDSITSDAINYYTLGSPYDNSDFMDMILYYQLYQNTSAGKPTQCLNKKGFYVESLEDRTKDFLSSLVSEAQRSENESRPFVFGFGYNREGNVGGHSVVVCGYNWNDDTNMHEIQIYDENAAEMESSGIEYDYRYLYVSEDYSGFSFQDVLGQCLNYSLEDIWIDLKYYGIDDLYSSANSIALLSASDDTDESTDTTTLQLSYDKKFKIVNSAGEWLSYDGTDYDGTMEVYDCYATGFDGDPVWVLTVDSSDTFTVTEMDNGFELVCTAGGVSYAITSSGADSAVVSASGVKMQGSSYSMSVAVESDSCDMIMVESDVKGDVNVTKSDDTLKVASTDGCNNAKISTCDSGDVDTQIVEEEVYSITIDSEGTITDTSSEPETTEATTESVEATTESVTESVEATTESTTEPVETATETAEETSQATETTTETAEATTESTEATTESTEDTTEGNFETYTYYFAPLTDYVEDGCTFILNIKDSNGDYTQYEMSATGTTFNGLAVYATTVTVNTNLKIADIQYQTYGSSGEWICEVEIEAAADYSEYADKIMVAESGELYDYVADEPTTEPSTTEEATTESTEVTESTEATTESTEPVAYDYYVVGDVALFGVDWAIDEAKGMTKGDDGDYYLTIENAPAGTYEFKVVGADQSWHPAGMGNNGSVTVDIDGATVTFRFNVEENYAIATTDGTIPTYYTEPTTESTEATTESTEATTESTEATTESTEPTTESTEATTESTEATTESTEPTSDVTDPTTESTEPTTAVKLPVTGVSVSASSVTLNRTNKNVSKTIKVTVDSPLTNCDNKIVVTSSNKKVAKVSSVTSSSFKITSVGKGTATITIKNSSDTTLKTVKVTVKQLVTKIKGKTVKIKNNKKNVITLSKYYTISPSNASNKSVKITLPAKARKFMKLKGNKLTIKKKAKKGTYKIKVTAKDGSKKSGTVTVKIK